VQGEFAMLMKLLIIIGLKLFLIIELI